MAIEASIQEKILKYLNSLPECIAENISGDASQKGRPDINCCFEGRCYRIEVKSEETGYKPTKLQILKLKKWAKAGAVCVIVWNLDEVKTLMSCHGGWSSKFRGWYIFDDGQIAKGDQDDT